MLSTIIASEPHTSDTAFRTPPSPALARQRSLLMALRDRLSSRDAPVRLLETHISYVLLTGIYAYKIKKAITLEFLDFGTLEARRRFCEEEVRLNQRLAPALYIDVVKITGSPTAPAIGGPGEVLEYAVRMREFAQDALLCDMLAHDGLHSDHVDALAARIADFHAAAPVALPDSGHGASRRVVDTALANFAEIAACAPESWDRVALEALRRWTRRQGSTIRKKLERRRFTGSIRECHGDLHLGNIALVKGEVTPFDCIEFNPSMRWIDTMSEVAFTVMDLERCGRPRLAYRFLSAYLERSGDYGGAAVLRFYLVYRAMVRAKVACLRASQAPANAREAYHKEFAQYVSIASSYAKGTYPAIVLMHGPSGCGKTTMSQLLLERAQAVRIRTDVERKRLALLPAEARSGSALDGGIYTPDATRGVYDHVRACAASIVSGGFPALVDGTFLYRWQRDMFRDLAAERAVPFVIVDCVASPATLEARVVARSRLGTDASEADVAVLRRQLRASDGLALDELRFLLACDAEEPFERGLSSAAWRAIEGRVRSRGAAPSDVRGSSLAAGPLADKVAFLSRPRNYPEPTGTVEPVETHRSWVFLTEQYAYKLKKPVVEELIELRSIEARRANCIEELRVNRRFDPDLYLDMVALTRLPSGALSVGGQGEPCDWLVRMRRLPADRMLDRLIAEGLFRASDLVPVVKLLCSVYRQSPASLSEEQYPRRLRRATLANRRELCLPEFGLSIEVIEDVCDRQLRFLDRASCFDERVRAKRIVDGHGDLRPEHICLDEAPRIIDALEFSTKLRTLDAVDEIGFLALECERLGAPQARRVLLDTYRREMDDAPPDALVHFYQSFRACVRARLAIRHLLDPTSRDPQRWPARARRYLELASRHVARCE